MTLLPDENDPGKSVILGPRSGEMRAVDTEMAVSFQGPRSGEMRAADPELTVSFPSGSAARISPLRGSFLGLRRDFA